MANVDNEIETETFEKCKNLCSEFLVGQWSKVSDDQFKIEKISGGFVNTKYSCEIPTELTNNNEPNKVIIHLHGNEMQDIKKIVRLSKSEIEEAIIAERLGYFDIGPRILGVFEGGRVEEFINGGSTKQIDLADENNLKKIARQLAKFHSLSMPLKRHIPFSCVMNKICTATPPRADADKFRREIKEMFDALVAFDINKELSWINKHFSIIKSPIVFAHNDLNGNNIMINNNGDVKFVDWDFSAYNYRGYDLGYLYVMKDIEIKREDSVPKSKIYERKENYEPFLRAYLDEFKRIVKINGEYSSNGYGLEDYDKLVMETEFFSLSAAMFFISFMYLAINTTPIDVLESRFGDRMELKEDENIGEYMLKFYKKTKSSFLNKYDNYLKNMNENC